MRLKAQHGARTRHGPWYQGPVDPGPSVSERTTSTVGRADRGGPGRSGAGLEYWTGWDPSTTMDEPEFRHRARDVRPPGGTAGGQPSHHRSGTTMTNHTLPSLAGDEEGMTALTEPIDVRLGTDERLVEHSPLRKIAKCSRPDTGQQGERQKVESFHDRPQSEHEMGAHCKDRPAPGLVRAPRIAINAMTEDGREAPCL